jgi:hypothetical protein
VALVADDLREGIATLQRRMIERERFPHAAIVERGELPRCHIESTYDGEGEPFAARLVRGVEVLRGNDLRSAETAIAAEYARADKLELGLPEEATNGEFLAAINRELERDPVRAMFLIRAVAGIEETGEAYSDLARLGRYEDRRGEYRLRSGVGGEEVEIGQPYLADGKLGNPLVFGELTDERRYRIDLVTHELVENRALPDGESWSEYTTLTPSSAEAARILADLNDLSGAIAQALADFPRKGT